MKNFFANILTLVMLSFFAVSCGSNGAGTLQGVQVSTTTNSNNDVMMSFAANLNLGALSFAAISLPIYNPQSKTQVGQVELVPGLNGVNQIKISVNLTSLSGVQTTMAVLPNGNMIPLIAGNQTVAVNLGNGARLYLSVSENVTAIGVAVPISAFDQIGSTLPGLNFFPIMNTNGVVATAGIFTGLNAGQNGIAVVADLSSIIKLGNIMPSSSIAMLQAEESQGSSIKLDYRSHKPNQSAQNKLAAAFSALNAKRVVLKIK